MKTQGNDIRTTRKERNAMIHAYILGCIDGAYYPNWTGKETDKEKIAFLLATFRKEYDFEIKRIGEPLAFRNWCQGLPTCFGIEFENWKILQLGVKWGILRHIPKEWRAETTRGEERKEEIFIQGYWDRLYMNVKAIEKKLNRVTPL